MVHRLLPFAGSFHPGKDIGGSKNNLTEVAQLFFISCLERGTLAQALTELGFSPISFST
jgi:hypothetical protein